MKNNTPCQITHEMCFAILFCKAYKNHVMSLYHLDAIEIELNPPIDF